MSDAIIWLNGDCVDEAQARLSCQDRGFLLGDGLFETLLAVNGDAKFAADHWARLRAGAAVLDITLDPSDNDLSEAAQILLERNDLTRGRAALRVTLTRGPGGRGLVPGQPSAPTLLMTAAPAPPVPESLSLHTSAIRRNPSSPLSRLKSLNYLDNVLARREALAAGADEALMLNAAGRAACAAAGNIWTLKDGTARTPPQSEGALAGIVRTHLLSILPEWGMEPREVPLTADDLAAADGLFVTNSLLGVCPVSSWDGKKYNTHFVSELREKFMQRCGY